MRKLFYALYCAAVGLSAATAEAGLITSAGSTTVQPVMKACATAYRSEHPQMRVIIAGGGSSKGVKTVARGRVDLGRASRQLKAVELKKYPTLKAVQVGIDGIAIVTHAQNSLSNITDEQVRQIYSGAIDNWKQLGGADAPIHLISLGTEHGTYELFSKYFHLKGSEVDGSIHFGDGVAWIAFSQQVALDRLAGDRQAIAFVSIGIGQRYMDETGEIKLLSLNGTAATEENVSGGVYKLSRPLLVLTNGEPAGEAKNFIDYLLSPQCQAIVKQLGYIPVH